MTEKTDERLERFQSSAVVLRGEKRRFGIDDAAKVTAICFAFLYAAGFIVVGISNSFYGITQFAPLKSRVFAAGALFWLLLGAPVIMVYRVYGFLRVLRHDASLPDLTREKETVLRRIVKICSYFFACVSLASAFNVIFWDSHPSRLGGWYMAILGSVLFGFMYHAWDAMHSQFNKHPHGAVILGCLTVIALLIWFRISAPGTIPVLTLWYFGVGVIAAGISSQAGKGLRNVKWESAVFVLLAFLAMFAIFLYGEIKPSIGGGAPQRVKVYLMQSTAVLPNRSTADLWLLDESDSGYYFVTERESKKAIYIPRQLVAGLQFSPSP